MVVGMEGGGEICSSQRCRACGHVPYDWVPARSGSSRRWRASSHTAARRMWRLRLTSTTTTAAVQPATTVAAIQRPLNPKSDELDDLDDLLASTPRRGDEVSSIATAIDPLKPDDRSLAR